MQTPPVKLLPVDPMQKSAPRPTVDRGFNDLLRQEPEPARNDERPVATSQDPHEVRKTDDTPSETDTSDRAPDPAPENNGAATDGTPAPQDQATGENTGANATDSANDKADPEALAAVITAPDAIQTSLDLTGDTKGEIAPGLTGAAGKTADGGTAVANPEGNSAPAPIARANIPTAVSVIETATEDTTPDVPENANPASPIATTIDGPAVAQESGAAHANTAAQTGQSAPVDSAAPPAVTLQPAPPADPGTVLNPAQAVVASAASSIRNGAVTSTPQNGSNTAGQPGDVPAPVLTPLNSDEEIFRPATAAPLTGQAPAAGNNQSTAVPAPGTPPVADSATGASTASPVENLSAGSNPAQLAADPPVQNTPNTTHQNGAPSTAFTNELRATPDAATAPDTATARNTPPPAVNQVAIQINRAVHNGQDQLTVNLKPGSLGKITVKLELGHDHRVIAVVSAERPDTLDLLQRDARTLERALQDAGLKTDSGSLSFNLQGESGSDSPFDDEAAPGRYASIPVSTDGDDPLADLSNPYARVTNASGVDIHV